MEDFPFGELIEAHCALLSTLHKCEKIDAAKLVKSKQTLLEWWIVVLRIDLVLIENIEK